MGVLVPAGKLGNNTGFHESDVSMSEGNEDETLEEEEGKKSEGSKRAKWTRNESDAALVLLRHEEPPLYGSPPKGLLSSTCLAIFP
jgi:hypothetical protein